MLSKLPLPVRRTARVRRPLLVVVVGLLLLAVGPCINRRSLQRYCTTSDVWLRSPDGTPIFSRRYLPRPAPPAASPAVILVHGYMGNLEMMESTLVRPLVARGFLVLNVDRRGHGRSSGALWPPQLSRPRRLQEFDPELRAAVAYLRALPVVDPDRIALIGHSDGARAAIMAACADWSINATVAISATLHPGDWVNTLAPKNLLLLYGSEEAFVTQADRANLFGRATDRSAVVGNELIGSFEDEDAREFISVERTTHVGVLYNSQAVREVVSWVERATGRRANPVPFETPPPPPFTPLFLGAAGALLTVLGVATAVVTASEEDAPMPTGSFRSRAGCFGLRLLLLLIAIDGSARLALPAAPWFAWLPLDGGFWFAAIPFVTVITLLGTVPLVLIIRPRGRRLHMLLPESRALAKYFGIGSMAGLVMVAAAGIAATGWYEAVPAWRKLAALPLYYLFFLAWLAALDIWIRSLLLPEVRGKALLRAAYPAIFLCCAATVYAAGLPSGVGVVAVPFYLTVGYFLCAALLACCPAFVTRPMSIAAAISLFATWITVLACPLY